MFTHYYVHSPTTGQHKVKFDRGHYAYKGVPMRSVGMPILEAYELINEWNRCTDIYHYWLEEESQ